MIVKKLPKQKCSDPLANIELKKGKSEIEKLVDEIYYRQTYGKNVDKHLEKLNRLTNKTKTVKAK